MSRHQGHSSKRISVFDRLGPDNERESSSHHAPPPPPPHPSSMRHRHYSDKHGSIPDDRREKRDSDRMPRKRRHGYDDEPLPGSSVDARPGKRDKPVSSSSRRIDPRDRSYSDKTHRMRSSTSLSSTEGGESDEEKKKSLSHSKRSKSQRESSGRSRDIKGSVAASEKDSERKDGDYGHCEDDRPRRKRDRVMESNSEGEEHKETKRRKMDDVGSSKGGGMMDDSSHHHYREIGKSRDRKDKRGDDHTPHSSSAHRKGTRKRSLYDSFSESEAEAQSLTDIDWFTLAKLPGPTGIKERKLSALEQYSAGAILSKIGVSSALAGPKLTSKVHDVVAKHLGKKYDCSESEFIFEMPGSNQGGVGGYSSLASQVEEKLLNKSFVSNIGPCRRALVASVDFEMRKKLRNINKKSDRVTESPGRACDLDDPTSTHSLPSATTTTTWDPELYTTTVSMYNDSDTANASSILYAN